VKRKNTRRALCRSLLGAVRSGSLSLAMIDGEGEMGIGLEKTGAFQANRGVVGYDLNPDRGSEAIYASQISRKFAKIGDFGEQRSIKRF